MIPVFQTVMRSPEDPDGAPGNCFAACLASLLEISIDEVPSPSIDDREDWSAPGRYWHRISRFLHERGLHMVEIDRDRTDGVEFSSAAYLEDPGFYWIATGLSPRGSFLHSVICRDAQIVHDPHPDGTGIEGGVVKAAYLVPLDPACSIRETPSPPPERGA